jgi:hypothetical protein
MFAPVKVDFSVSKNFSAQQVSQTRLDKNNTVETTCFRLLSAISALRFTTVECKPCAFKI